ncbi:formate dehydrogenase [Methanoculleus taiwanensis]|uniref:Formate dehydrogenase n=1 Tax=Methanoculleus taiwanensis TaxID=1550565 RepID=A0A498GWS3_9EURY|nr:Coenzyme F420 hydrogenase/dehydrogenase, beta subunit C-terminal domain [Methanoculleus taiwanensis]RXE55063.1 formate dehydrogenase [Methanoculleus taiwanensis]
MAAQGDKIYAWAADAACQEKGECGGAVSALLKYALESGTVDAVLAIKKGQDIYDAVPTLITDPAQIAETSGSLHCGTLLLSKLFKKYFDGAKNMKIAVPVKGCDAMGLYELAKRNQVNLDNVYMIGLNCGGSVSPVSARKMITEKFGISPDDVVKEEIDKGQFIVITKDGQHKGISIDELEEEGYGRRSNCRRCKMKVPRQADLAAGNWGVIGDKAGKATFIEVCSEKGANLLSGAEKAGAVKTEAAPAKGIEIRGKVENAMLKLGDKWRAHDFGALGEGRDRLQTIMEATSRCIKCYACIENCPICYCVECSTKKADMVEPGKVPPDFMFHLIRFAHISDSCVNCGQCEELCAMDIPNALFMHALQVDLEEMFGQKPGVDMTLPILALVDEKSERKRLNDTGDDQIFNIFK